MAIKKSIYISFIKQVKEEILSSRYTAAKLVNKELLLLYFKVGKLISERIEKEKWGSKVIETISTDLQKNLQGLRGFSATNLKYMKRFYEMYSFLPISQLPTDQFKKGQKNAISQLTTDQFKHSVGGHSVKIDSNFLTSFFLISFSHHYKIISQTSSWEELSYYVIQTAENRWTVSALEYCLETKWFKKKGKMINNFKRSLPAVLHEKAVLAFKDEYLLDFINIQDPNEIDERVIENAIVNNIKQFLLTLGKEFAFMGNQYRLLVEDEELFVDLLFYHRALRCLVAIDLKAGKFKAEYAGKMNLYLSALNKSVKLTDENPSIGIILCKEKNNTIVEYSFTDINKPIGVGTYKHSTKLPNKMKKYLPKPEDFISVLNEPNIFYSSKKD
jgi:predicted nuclease of restriction endonuclease-like (RecB) superfamily